MVPIHLVIHHCSSILDQDLVLRSLYYRMDHRLVVVKVLVVIIEVVIVVVQSQTVAAEVVVEGARVIAIGVKVVEVEQVQVKSLVLQVNHLMHSHLMVVGTEVVKLDSTSMVQASRFSMEMVQILQGDHLILRLLHLQMVVILEPMIMGLLALIQVVD